MNIMEGSYVIGCLGIDSVIGSKAIASGALDLGFSVDWTQHARGRRILSGSLRLTIKDHGDIGTLSLHSRILEVAREDRHGGHVYFKGHLPFAVLEGIEKIRAGHDLSLIGDLRLLTDDGGGSREPKPLGRHDELQPNSLWQSEINLNIPAVVWIKALDGMGFRRFLYLETTFPYDPDARDPLAVRLKRARDAFDGGRYENCVSEVRHILTVLGERRSDIEAAVQAAEKYRGNRELRESMSLSERLLAVRKCLEHVAHFAHHPGEEEFYRKSAKFCLTTLAATLELYQEPLLPLG